MLTMKWLFYFLIIFTIVGILAFDNDVYAQITISSDPVAVIIDGDGEFTTLDGSRDITTVEIDGKIYALVIAEWDDGVQIIDISTPSNPTLVAAITDGDEFTTLDGPRDIATVEIDGKIYALVTSNNDDGVQIIDISTPSTPTPVAAIIDRVDGFTTLLGAYGVTTVEIDGKIYALVTADISDGVQIIDISTPSNPTPVAAITDWYEKDKTVPVDQRFPTLNGAQGITTVEIDDKPYALVAASLDNGVQIINMTNPSNPTSVAAITDGNDEFTTLEGAHGITTVEIDGKPYALVAAEIDDGIQIIDISNPSLPAPVAALTDYVPADVPEGSVPVNQRFTTLDRVTNITTVEIDDKPYALVTSRIDDGIQIIDISTPSTPTSVAAITDGNEFTTLEGAYDVTTVVIDDKLYTLVAAFHDNGIQIIDITDPINPAPVAAITDGDGGFTELLGAHGITTVKIGAKIYALVAADRDDGVQIIDISTPSTPTPVAAITDWYERDLTVPVNQRFTELNEAANIAIFEIDAKIYALVVGSIDDGIQIIDISNPSLPVAVAAITDYDPERSVPEHERFTTLDGAYGITTVKIGAKIYALVAAIYDDGIQIIDISNPSLPAPVAAITDYVPADVPEGSVPEHERFTELDGAYGITTVEIDGKPYALVASNDDDGVQIIDITDPSNPAPVAAITDYVPADDLEGSVPEHERFTELLGAYGITTVEIDGKIYALVTAQFDYGVQIIDITDPSNPAPVAAITYGNEFTTLEGPTYIDTVKIGENTFALVIAEWDDGVQIIDITDPSNPAPVAVITDGVEGFTTLHGLRVITTILHDFNTYALVTSNNDAGVEIMRLELSCTGEQNLEILEDGALCTGTVCTDPQILVNGSCVDPVPEPTAVDYDGDDKIDLATQCPGEQTLVNGSCVESTPEPTTPKPTAPEPKRSSGGGGGGGGGGK